jgi:small subunit ribosomal protein S2
MRPYIFGVRNTISVIDLTQTREKLEQAANFIKETVARGGMLLLVGTKPGAKKLIKETAEKTNMPYLTERWIGGSLTNFKVVAKRVEYMESLEKERDGGGFEKYTKRERLKKEEQIEKLRRKFDGLRPMKKLPDTIFIVDINQDHTAVSEGKKIKIPTIALVDTNSNGNLVDWPIPANDDALPSLRLMIGRIERAIVDGLEERQKNKTEEQG